MATGEGTSAQILRDAAAGPQLPATEGLVGEKQARGQTKFIAMPRRHTRPGIDPLDQVTWTTRRSVITDPDGTVVFRLDDVEVPEDWSQLATDIAILVCGADGDCNVTRASPPAGI